MSTNRKFTFIFSSLILIFSLTLPVFQPVSAKAQNNTRQPVDKELALTMSMPILQMEEPDLTETPVPAPTEFPQETPIPADTSITDDSSLNGEVVPHVVTTWYVATTGNDTNSCTTTGSPCLTINGAIGKAANEDAIKVAIGTYTGSGTEVVLINKSISLSGGWNSSFSTQNGLSSINGADVRRGVSLDGSFIVNILNFNILNGISSVGGGGVYNLGSTLTLTNCIIDNNQADAGPFADVYGGGIYNTGTLTINNSTVSNNSADGPAGGILNYGGILTLNNSAVTGNTAGDTFWGGGVYGNSTITLNNTTVSGNSANNGSGGGIYAWQNGPVIITLNNSTVSNNSANLGGGIGADAHGSFAVNLKNSIVAGNFGVYYPDCSAIISSLGYNLMGNNSGCTINPITGDLIGTSTDPINPALGPLQNNGGTSLTHALIANSPAIDAGNPASPGSGGNACLSTDQRGISRPVGTACDIGAFESPFSMVFVNISGNAGVAGATLSYKEYVSKTAVADGGGNYSFLVRSGWSGTVTPSKGGYTFTPANRTYNSITVDQTTQDYSETYIFVSPIQDPSFESYTPNPYWSETSTNFGTPLCSLADCGTGGGSAMPRTGSIWGWFGGVPTNETASISQTVTFPNGVPNLKLQFYFWIGAVGPGSDASDVFTAQVDGVTVFSASATQQALYPAYTLVMADVSAFADGASHTITFSSVTTNQLVTFNLDDVALTNSIFFDVPSDYGVLQFIERLYNAGITGGCSVVPLMYCPDFTVSRAQMAVFLLRGIHGSGYVPPAVGVGTGFADVPANHPVAAWIKQLSIEGITGGCGGGNYCPDATVTRAQMAIFLLRAKYTSAYTPPPANGDFSDVPVIHPAAAWIEQLSLEGITGGCGAGVYCPDAYVTRAQMAVFLVRTFNLP